MKTIIKLQILVIFMSLAFFTKVFYVNNGVDVLDGVSQERLYDAFMGQGAPYLNAEQENMDTDNSDKIPMQEHMRFYKLNDKVHYDCPRSRRPRGEDIEWRKNIYQRIILKFEDHPENEIFGMNFYFDDRFLIETGQRFVRGIITVHGPGHLKNAEESKDVLEWAWAMNRHPWNVLMWYDKFSDPIGVACKLQAAGGLNRNVSNTYFFQEIVTCAVPEIGMLPSYVSIVHGPCEDPVTYFPVVYPEEPEQGSNREIGVCMASLFGNMSGSEVTYFVNWMEALKLLGVNEVSLNNGSLYFLDDDIRRAFNYYISIGRLTFTHYPPVHEKWNSPDEDDAATEAVNKLTTGDCIYRNIKQYWYTLIIDMDELPVPTYFNTYQEFIADYTSRFPNTTHAHCLAVRSSFFYRGIEAGNPEYPEHLPLMRLTKRFRPEPIEVDGVGISKSFHNTRYMVAAGHHLTRQTHSGGGSKHLIHQFTDPEEILIHHYRRNCKWQAYCRDHWNETIHDDIVPRKYGDRLRPNVEYVLNKIGYKF